MRHDTLDRGIMNNELNINPNRAARARWENHHSVRNIILRPVKQVVAELLGVLELSIAQSNQRPIVAYCEVDERCMPLCGITKEILLLNLSNSLTRILGHSTGRLQLIPSSKEGYLLLEFTCSQHTTIDVWSADQEDRAPFGPSVLTYRHVNSFDVSVSDI